MLEQEARALARALEAAGNVAPVPGLYYVCHGPGEYETKWGVSLTAHAYPSDTPQGRDACTGLFLRALAALGYNVSPRYFVSDGDWCLVLSPGEEAKYFGPDLLPLLASALIAHGLKLGETAPPSSLQGEQPQDGGK
jgi:hypothetical protein